MDTFMCVLAWLEAHPGLATWAQGGGVLLGAGVVLVAANRAYKSVTEQIGASLVLDNRSRSHEQGNIYRALAADLDALNKSLVGFRDALTHDTDTEGRRIFKSVFLASRNVVWESCAPKIGVIDANCAANIIETYRFIEAITGRVRELDMEDADHRADIASLIDEATKQINIVLKGLPFRPDRENADTK